MASTSALSALSRPSSSTSRPMVRKSEAWTSITRGIPSGLVVQQHRRFVAHRVVAPGTQVGHGEDDDDQRQREPPVDLEVNVAGGVEVLDQELDADPRDDQEGAVDDSRIAA